MEFKRGPIDGVQITPARKFVDDRGWLLETFRQDEIDRTYFPVMAYTSLSYPGVVRGPHEHTDQSDLFVFMGPGNFKIWLWDNRKSSATYFNKLVVFGGEDNPLRVLVPPGVVHAYRNTSGQNGVVHNFPNQLFMGQGRKSPIDEIRHEHEPDTIFRCE